MRPEPTAAVIAAGIALVLFSLRLSPGVAFGPWQGPMLDPDSVVRVPLLTRGAASLASLIDYGNPAWRLNVLSAVLGAASCGLVAAIAARVALRFADKWSSMIAGAGAGLLFAVSHSVMYTATAASPAMSSVLPALASLFMLTAAGTNIDGSRTWLLCAGAFTGGLAAADNATLGLLYPLVIVALITYGTVTSRTIRAAVFATVAFFAGAGIPLVYALTHGTMLREFLYYGLRQSYPSLFDGMPDPSCVAGFAGEYHWALLFLIVPGAVFLFRRDTVRDAVFVVAIWLFMGPLRPALVNHPAIPSPEVSTQNAPHIVALAFTACFISWGLLDCVSLFRGGGRRVVPAAIPAVSFMVLVGLLFYGGPDRRHHIASRLGREILASCPKCALLISGNACITSLASAVQHGDGYRNDVVVIPADYLAHGSWDRRRLKKVLDNEVKLDVSFPPPDADERWPKEQPVLFSRFLEQQRRTKGNGTNTYLLDLALWDFIKDNYDRRPLCFVGLNSSWLAARAELSGVVLLYPRVYEPASPAFAGENAYTLAVCESYNDPGLPAVLSPLLVTLSNTARKQGRPDESVRLARFAVELDGQSPMVRLALARAQARQGNKLAAMNHMESYIEQSPSDEELAGAQRDIERDLISYIHEREFMQAPAHERNGPSNRETRHDAAMDLWQDDEPALLAKGYEQILEADNRDAEAVYQLSAAYVQLGDLARARDLLGRWAELVDCSRAAAQRLHRDARFALLRDYQSNRL